MKMLRGPGFLRRFGGTWLFAAQPGGRTRVTFRYSFAAPWWLAAVVHPGFAWAFRRQLRARLRGLAPGPRRWGCSTAWGRAAADGAMRKQ